jgi:MazG family protein
MAGEKKIGPCEVGEVFSGLVEIVHRLRAPGGCPWDREQTAKSLKSYIVEEAYEVLDAIDGEHPEELSEELGDLLLQIVLQAEIAAEKGFFSIENVIEGISKKLKGRHPHVFGETSVDNSQQVLVNWERIKKSEKADRGLFDGLPSRLPALQRAARIGEKAARVGFDWPDSDGVRQKVEEKLAELDEAISNGDTGEIRHELGDLLFAVAQWARHIRESPEEALRDGCARFVERFKKMEKTIIDSGASLEKMDIDTLENVWQKTTEI